MAEQAKEVSVKEAKFTKAQLLQAKTLGVQKDVLAAVLEDGKEYTKKEVESLIRSYLKKEV